MTPRSIPFFKFSDLFKENPERFTETFRRTMGAGQIILQQPVDDFEKSISDFLGAKHVIGLSDGTRAIEMGVRAMGLGPEDEVIFCSHTFVATAQAIHYATAKPIPADMQADRMIDPASVERLITGKTKAIMVTQLNGRTCNMDEIQEVADRAGIAVLEDAAQALGSAFGGKRAGTFGLFGTISLYPSKLLGGFGDGGLLVTDDDALAERVIRMRNHGANAAKQLDPDWRGWGTNSRLDTLLAALLTDKLEAFPASLARRRQIARTYQTALSNLPDFGLPPGPDSAGGHFDVYQNYEVDCGDRETLRGALQAAGIGTIVQWAGQAVHHLTGLGMKAALPQTDQFFKRCFLLPMNQFLSDDEVLYICSAVRAHYGQGEWSDMAVSMPADTPKPARDTWLAH